MTDYTASIADIVRGRAERGMANLLLTVFDAGVAMGMGVAREMPSSPQLTILLDSLRDRWLLEVEASKCWVRAPAGAPGPELLPAWLLACAAEPPPEDVPEEVPFGPLDDVPESQAPYA